MMTDQQALHEYAASQDAEAFRVLVEQYQHLVYSAASRRLRHVEDVEDVVQLTFLKLARSARTIHRDLSAWLYTTTINTANDLIRRDQTRRRHEALASARESFTDDAEREQWDKLSLLIDEVLLEMPESQRSVLVEYFLRGRSQRDLADELSVSQPSAFRRIQAAVEELRKRLADHEYSIATPLLASALGSIPQPSIPATVTAELVKVGLSGVSAGSVASFSLSATPLWIKIGVATMTLSAVFVGAISLLPATAASSPPGPALAPAQQAPSTASIPADWRSALYQAYALAPNQNLKFIPPPPLPERQRYLLEVENNDAPMPFIQWRWINGALERQRMQGSGPAGASLSSVLGACAGLDGHHLSIQGVPAINADGDWIVRDGATTEAILADLHSILLDRFRADVLFEKNEVTKDALVATGHYRLQRIPDATAGDLQVFSDVMDHPKPGDSIMGGGSTSPAEFWTILGGYIGIPIVDESTNEPAKIYWLLSRSIANAEKQSVRQQIIDNITKQTGLVFKQEKRTFTTWQITSR